MSFEEKSTWIMALVTAGAYAAYLVVVLGQAGDNRSLAEVSYIPALLWAIGVAIVASIAGHILVAVAAPAEADKRDQRDTEIHRFGEYVGFYVLAVGAVGALGLALAESAHFWIANAIYLAFVLATLTSSIVKIVVYRRGF